MQTALLFRGFTMLGSHFLPLNVCALLCAKTLQPANWRVGDGSSVAVRCMACVLENKLVVFMRKHRGNGVLLATKAETP